MHSRINHVSINARDLQESVDFYVELLGAEPIATPNFGIPVQWLALGRTQLHLFEKELQPTSHHHLGITVDVVQLYLRDPAGTSSRSTTTASTACPTTCAAGSSACGSSTRRAKNT